MLRPGYTCCLATQILHLDFGLSGVWADMQQLVEGVALAAHALVTAQQQAGRLHASGYAPSSPGGLKEMDSLLPGSFGGCRASASACSRRSRSENFSSNSGLTVRICHCGDAQQHLMPHHH